MKLKLLVIRTPHPQQLADFYTQLGLIFEYHQHSNGPFHFSAYIGATVFEIYPLKKNNTQSDIELRLGFEIENFDEILQKLILQNVKIIAAPMETEWGLVAIVQDPDGRKIELYKKEN